jgi:benzodiazapine receptor
MLAVQTSDIVLLLLPTVFGLLSGLVKRRTASAKNSAYQPPGWVFGVAWTILYILLGISIFLQWRRSGRKYDTSVCLLLTIFVLLNTWWYLFGGTHTAPIYSFVFIVISTLLVYYTTLHLFLTNNIIAASITLPLVAWMSFASFLTYDSQLSNV